MFDLCRKIDRILELLIRIHREIEKMAIDQATFDGQLKALTDAITQFIADVQAKAGVDLSAESASVQAALAAITAADPNAVPAPPSA